MKGQIKFGPHIFWVPRGEELVAERILNKLFFPPPENVFVPCPYCQHPYRSLAQFLTHQEAINSTGNCLVIDDHFMSSIPSGFLLDGPLFNLMTRIYNSQEYFQKIPMIAMALPTLVRDNTTYK